MADSYIGEIQAFPYSNLSMNSFLAGNCTWFPCFGQVLAISANTALFSLIGTFYGGNGTTNFQLPNLNGFITNSQGTGPGIRDRVLGEVFGSNQVSVFSNEMPAHIHGLQLGKAGSTGAQAGPGQGTNMAAIDPAFNGFVALPNNTTFAPNAMTFTGGGQPHANTQPTIAIVWCICTAGIYPSFGLA